MFAEDAEESVLDSPARAGNLGTLFSIYPQAPHVFGYGKPESVWLSPAPGGIRAGPEDSRIYVRDPLFDKKPYGYPEMPPFEGAARAPAEPDFEGHFDSIDVGSRQFLAAHAYACVRRVLDIWESHLGRRIEWHFAADYERLEIIPYIDWDNAQSGYGYLELGHEQGRDGGNHPFALNFDVIAHEIGHSILFSLVGMPAGSVNAGEFAPFHEANADLISLLSFLHFDSGMDRLLRRTKGNLLMLNELNRIAELSDDSQIRLACNYRRMSEVSAEVHDRSRPFSGAVFDTIVDEYHRRLVADGLANPRLLSLDLRDADEAMLDGVSRFTADAFEARPFAFKSALEGARNDVAKALALAWPRLDPGNVTFANAALTAIGACSGYNGFAAAKFEENFVWREIL
jgi:hypothetical protein